MEKKHIKVSFDEGRKTVTLDKRAIRKATSKAEWLKGILPATKGFGVSAEELEKKIGEAFEAVRGETAEKEAKPKK